MHRKAVKHNSKQLVIKEIDDYGLYSSYILKWDGNRYVKLFCCIMKEKSCIANHKAKIYEILW